MITYGPFTWAQTWEELDNPRVNYFHPSYPVGVDKDGVPIDERGIQLLDNRCIVHPWAKVEYREVMLEGEKLKIPLYEGCCAWFEDNHYEISRTLINRYRLRWALKHNVVRSRVLASSLQEYINESS